MWLEYLQEREGVEAVIGDNGFALVKVQEGMLYLQDIYVKPEFRQTGEGRKLLEQVEQIARELGFSAVLGSCSPVANGSTGSLKAMLACGFELYRSETDIIYLLKRLQEKVPGGQDS